MCDFFFFFFKFFSIAILGSRYDTRIAGPSIAMHRCIVTPLRDGVGVDRGGGGGGQAVWNSFSVNHLFK